MDAILTEVDDDRRLVSNSERIIYQLYYCGDPLCLGEVLEQEGHDLAKRIIQMASQDTVAARAMANKVPFDQLAKNQLIVAVDTLRSAPRGSRDVVTRDGCGS